MTAPLLELANVSKRFRDGVRGQVTAVADVSLSLSPGQVLRVEGPSGAGKSTLLSLCAGLALPTAGEVKFRGETLSRLRERFRAETRRTAMGIVLQGLALVPKMSVIENVLLADVPAGRTGARDVDAAMPLLARLGIDALAGAAIETLSGGERQRVALARALRGEPALLLLDEPTAHLDAAHVHVLAELLDGHRRRGAAILVATHDARLAASGEGATTVNLHEGKLVARALDGDRAAGH